MVTKPGTGPFGARDDKSDEDSISLTSTILSEPKDEYPVEAILAEEKFKGITKYLVKWEGYPENRCTWETRSNFQDGEDSTFHTWTTQKMRMSRGLIKSFDVPAFQRRVETWLDGIERRKLRRRAKRQRLGQPVDPVAVESIEDSSDSQAEEGEEQETVQRRSSLKRNSDAMLTGSDETQDSQAMDTESSDSTTTTTHSQWTPQAESALLQGLEFCKGPDWSRILKLHPELLGKYTNVDLELQARRIKSSFLESGKEIPSYLQEISNKLSTTSARENVGKTRSQRRNTIKSTAAPNRDDSDSNDSLIEEIRMKAEAKKRRRMQKAGAVSPSEKNRNDKKRSKGASAAKSRSNSANAEIPGVLKSADKVKVREMSAASSETASSSKASSKHENGSTAMNRGRLGSTSIESRPPSFQEPSKGVGSGFVAATATMIAPQRSGFGSGSHRPNTQPQNQMGAIGRGPRRPISANVFLPARKKKNHATGAAVLSNWDAPKQRRGSHGAALKINSKPSEFIEKPKKYNSYAVLNRVNKFSRVEPAPNLNNLQLIDPKDGKAIKVASAGKATPTENKSAMQIFQERLALAQEQEQEQQQEQEQEQEQPSHEEKDDVQDDMNDLPMDKIDWIDAVNAGSEIVSEREPQQETTPKFKDATPEPEISGKEDTSICPTVSAVTNIEKKKRASLSLQAYSQKFLANSSNSGSLAINTKTSVEKAIPSNPLSADSNAIASTHNQTETLLRSAPLTSNASSAPLYSSVPLMSPTNDSSWRFADIGSRNTDQKLPRGLPSHSSAIPAASLALKKKHPEIDPIIFANDPDEIYGTLWSAPERISCGPVRFRDFDRPARQDLINNRTGKRENFFWFTQMYTAADYQSHFSMSKSKDHVSHGYIAPFSDNMPAIDGFTETLRLNASGSFYHGQNFSLLVYPNKSEEWAFMDQTFPELPSSISLRAVFRSPSVQTLQKARNYETADGRRHRGEKGKQFTFVTNTPSISSVMHNVYNIDYQRLIRQQNEDKTRLSNRFFLIFPKDRKDEQDLVTQFLDANGAAEIYAYNEHKSDGSWEYYRNNVQEGVIIAHSSFWQFHHLPRLCKLLKGGDMNIFHLQLRRSRNTSHRHLVRLFPHGTMMLITDSLLLLQPLEALRVLTWFRLRVVDEKPNGTWKIITRPHIRRFLINCCRERKLDEEGKHFVQIYEQISFMLDPDDLYDWDEDEPKEEAPIYCMKKIKSFNTKVGRRVNYNKDPDLGAIQRNDDVLADFFAGWANVHMEHYRRFHIISGFGEQAGRAQRETWMEKWSYCEAFHPTNFYTRYNVPEQPELDERAVKKHEDVMQMLQMREEYIEEGGRKDHAAHETEMASMEKHWRKQIERDPKLRETYEGLMEDGGVEGIELVDKDVVDGKGNDQDDDWSDDERNGNGSDFEMGDGDAGQHPVDLNGDISGLDNWSLQISDSESDSFSDGY